MSKNNKRSGPRCFSCDKELWPAKYNGYIVVMDGEARCYDCAKANKPWLPKYKG